jgi:hypothetical protein
MPDTMNNRNDIVEYRFGHHHHELFRHCHFEWNHHTVTNLTYVTLPYCVRIDLKIINVMFV